MFQLMHTIFAKLVYHEMVLVYCYKLWCINKINVTCTKEKHHCAKIYINMLNHLHLQENDETEGDPFCK